MSEQEKPITQKSNFESPLLPGYLQTQHTKNYYKSKETTIQTLDSPQKKSQKEEFAARKQQISYEMPEYFTSVNRSQGTLVSTHTFNKPNFDNIEFGSPTKAKLQKVKKQVGSICQIEEYKIGEHPDHWEPKVKVLKNKPMQVENKILNSKKEVIPPPRIREKSRCSETFQEIQNSEFGSSFFRRVNGPFSNQSDNVISQQKNFDRDLRHKSQQQSQQPTARKSSEPGDILDKIQMEQSDNQNKNNNENPHSLRNSVQLKRLSKPKAINNKHRHFNSISYLNQQQMENNINKNKINNNSNLKRINSQINESDEYSQLYSANRFSKNEIQIQENISSKEKIDQISNMNDYSYRHHPYTNYSSISLSPQKEKQLDKFFENSNEYYNTVQHSIDKDLINSTLNQRKQLKQKQTKVPKILQQKYANQPLYYSQVNTSRKYNQDDTINSHISQNYNDKSRSMNKSELNLDTSKIYLKNLQHQTMTQPSKNTFYNTKYSNVFQDLAKTTLSSINQNNNSEEGGMDLSKQQDHKYKQRVLCGNFSRFSHSNSIRNFEVKYKVQFDQNGTTKTQKQKKPKDLEQISEQQLQQQ